MEQPGRRSRERPAPNAAHRRARARHERHQRRRRQSRQREHGEAVARVVPGMRPKVRDMDRSAAGVDVPDVETPGRSRNRHGQNALPCQAARIPAAPIQRKRGPGAPGGGGLIVDAPASSRRGRRTAVRPGSRAAKRARDRNTARRRTSTSCAPASRADRATQIAATDGGDPQRVRFALSRESTERRRDQEPSFVARQRRGQTGDACRRGCPPRLIVAEQDGEVERAMDAREEDRLGHRDRLQIAACSDSGRQSASATAPAASLRKMRRAAANRKMPPMTKQIAEGIAPASPLRQRLVARGEGHHQQVRQRQPDACRSGRSRGCANRDAARDIEVRLGVAVVENIAAVEEEGRPRRRSSRPEPRATMTIGRSPQNAVQVSNSW